MAELPTLSVQTLWDILDDNLSDEVTNQLVWRSLGYRYSEADQTWSAQNVDEAWLAKYPHPPDFIDSRPATVQLTRSIPKENKQLLKTFLGFKGYSVSQLVPRLTRRATMANWLLSYMKEQGLVNIDRPAS